MSRPGEHGVKAARCRAACRKERWRARSLPSMPCSRCPEADRWIGDGKRARVLGRAARGGVRVDGGDGGFRERTVSLADIAWVIVAADHAAEEGGRLDEERVNRLRYLEGTPKGSTRWIDTGWAIALWNAVKGSVRDSGRGRRAAPADAAQRRHGDRRELPRRAGRRGAHRRVRVARRDARLRRPAKQRLRRGARAPARPAGGCAHRSSRMSSSSRARRRSYQARSVGCWFQDQPYPLAIDDPAALGRKLGAGQARVGRAPGARGSGNRTRRIRLFLTATSVESAAELARFLASGKP